MIYVSEVYELKLKCGGVSIKGNHEKNQDYYIYRCFEWGAVVAVSDGLGSKKYSEVGSKTICEAVVECAEQCNGIINETDEFLQSIHRNWLKKSGDYDIKECYATCLIVIINKDEVFAAQLGDGFIGIVDKNETLVLLDDKSQHFVNETDCLCEIFQLEFWRIVKLEAQNILAVILSTDGMSIGNETKKEMKEFCYDFYEGYNFDTPEEIEKNINGWLADWYGGDDKTIAFVMRD